MQNIASIAVAALMPAEALTATDTGTGVDVSDFTGLAKFVLNSSVMTGAGATSDVKLQHSDTIGGTYTDTGIAFTQTTLAGGASFQVIDRNVDGLKKFVRVVSTLAGSSPTVTQSVTIIGKKANG